jgi:hypothetical protein
VAFSWRKFTVFGFTIALPTLIILLRVSAEQATAFAKHKEEMRSCNTCHRCFNHKAGVRLIMHLQDYHGFTEDTAISIVDDLYKKLIVIWKKK